MIQTKRKPGSDSIRVPSMYIAMSVLGYGMNSFIPVLRVDMFRSNSSVLIRHAGRLTMSRQVPVGKALILLQEKILKAYPEGTKLKILAITIEVTEPGKEPKEKVLKYAKGNT
jgi:hypothetical protein